MTDTFDNLFVSILAGKMGSDLICQPIGSMSTMVSVDMTMANDEVAPTNHPLDHLRRNTSQALSRARLLG